MDESTQADRTRHAFSWMLCCLLCVCSSACSIPNRWIGSNPPPCVLEPGVTQAQLVAHLNKNIIGTSQQGGLVSWRANNAKIHVTGVPLPLPANIAVESSRKLRIVVSNPMTRGQEVDIGSNPERFWFWSKEAPGVMTCKHEQAASAMEQMQLPIQIDPDWLMEIFGVIPIDNNEYTMVRSQVGTADLVAIRQMPNGKNIERIIRVDTCQGVVTEHALKYPGGDVIARAKLDKYSESPTGVLLPMVYKIDWPAAKVSLSIHLNHPEVNPSTLAGNSAIWEVPNFPGVRVVDVGQHAQQFKSQINPTAHRSVEAISGQIGLAPTMQLEAPIPSTHRLPVQSNPFMHPNSTTPKPFPAMSN